MVDDVHAGVVLAAVLVVMLDDSVDVSVGIPPALVALSDGEVVVVDAVVAWVTVDGVVVVVVVVDVGMVAVVLLWSPTVFQMEGPTELNHGGLGLDVDDVCVAVESIEAKIH